MGEAFRKLVSCASFLPGLTVRMSYRFAPPSVALCLLVALAAREVGASTGVEVDKDDRVTELVMGQSMEEMVTPMAEAQHRRLPNKQKEEEGPAATVELLAQEEVPFLTQWERDAQEERRRYRMAQVNQVLNRAHGDLLAEEMSPTQAAHLKKRVQAVRDALTRAKGALGLAQTSSTVSEETVEEETTTMLWSPSSLPQVRFTSPKVHLYLRTRTVRSRCASCLHCTSNRRSCTMLCSSCRPSDVAMSSERQRNVHSHAWSHRRLR